ncbi:unnamed protein product [Periconia digitata]|uniref:Uncharacterized protein n=1 Tax=Periconia digitata TaxID=1303443 RepID=A0A9W4U6G6_9PLEO|nr:unnamed protein product [Periconia digitata]
MSGGRRAIEAILSTFATGGDLPVRGFCGTSMDSVCLSLFTSPSTYSLLFYLQTQRLSDQQLPPALPPARLDSTRIGSLRRYI